MKKYTSKTIQIGIICVISLIVIGIIGVLVYNNSHSNSASRSYQNPSAFHYADLIKNEVLYPVVRVIDGDTLITHVEDKDITIRLIGIDTPEVVDPRKPVQCYGKDASEKAKSLLTGAQVYIEKDPSKGDYDKYGRTLAYIRLNDQAKTLFNLQMIKEGFAREYTYFREAYRYQPDFKSAESIARKTKVGLWNPSNCPD